jgi:pimeloyl-ACP methyl ester carboxylesterase
MPEWKSLLEGLKKGSPFSALAGLVLEGERVPVPRLLEAPAAEGLARSFDGTRIHWERHGPDPASCDKTPLLFCYGLVCSVSQWREQVRRYSAERPCVLFDYRGHHSSEGPSDRRLLNIPALARDARAALLAAGVRRPAHVWGHSLGCNVALELAVADAAAVRSLTLLCGTVVSPFHKMFGTDLLEKLANPVLGGYAGREVVYNTVWGLLMKSPDMVALVAKLAGFNSSASTADDIKTYAYAVANVAPETFFRLLIDLHKGGTAPLLPKVRTPSLVVAGAKDHVTPPSEQKYLAGKLHDASYCEVPLGSHNVQTDFGEYVCLKAEAFWRERGLDS